MSFKIATRFREAAVVINTLPIDKFPHLLTRVLGKLHLRNLRLFTEEEEEKMKTLFSLSGETLRLVLDCCCYIFEQAAFAATGPEPLYDILLSAGFHEAHGKVVGRMWASEAAEFIGKLKERTLGGNALLETSYHFNLIMSESQLSKQHEPTAIFEFNLSQAAEGKEGVGEKQAVEFTHQELYSFFGDLERIQHQLDALSGAQS